MPEQDDRSRTPQRGLPVEERKHQGLGNRLLVPMEQVGGQSGSVRKRERLGGMLNYLLSPRRLRVSTESWDIAA
jgi:hypothetical protein